MKNGFLKEPPMGWNSWDCYGAGVTEEILLANAAFMRDRLKPLGYEYVCCDIQWSEPNAHGTGYHKFTELCMDEYSRLIPAENRFPSAAGGKGFGPLAAKIHDMGLKFGIHIMRGVPRQAVHRNTPIKCPGVTARDIAATYSICPWNTDMYGVDRSVPGAQEYYDSLFELYASWGVDYVKVDDIAKSELTPNDRYSCRGEVEMIREAIRRCGRPIVLSLSPGPATLSAHEHLAEWADLWRISEDFWDEWRCLRENFDLCRDWAPYVQPGSYPDCDMLPLGTISIYGEYRDTGRYTRFTHEEQKTMMTLWCIFGSPLIIGGDLPTMDEYGLSLLTNPRIVAMDKTTREPEEVSREDDVIVWRSRRVGGGRYLAVFNVGEEEKTVSLDVAALAPEARTVTDLWSGCGVAPEGGRAVFRLPAHGAAAVLAE